MVTHAEYYSKRRVMQPGNREWVTAIETINSSGWALPPTIIFKVKIFNQVWFSNIPRDWRIEVSENR